METTKITTPNVSFPEAEKNLIALRTDLLEIAKRDGKYYGLKNLPALDDASLMPYYGNIKTRSEHGRSDILTVTQPDMHISAIQTLDADTKTKTDELSADIDRLAHENDVDKRELEGKTRPEKCKPNYLSTILSIVVNLADLVFNAMAFEFLGEGLAVSIAIGLGVSAAMYVLSNAIVYFVRRAVHESKKFYLAAAGCFFAACGAFWVFSNFRAQMMAESDVSISPQIFFLLNMFFFVASIVIPIIFFQPKNESEAQKELSRRFDLIDERKAEIKQKKAELDAINKTAKEEREKHLAILSYVTHTMNRITSMYYEAVASFKSQILLTRQDRKVPQCFSEPIADLSGVDFKLPPSLNLPSA
jgi:hypothetical protein